MKTKKLSAMLLLISIAFISCTKEGPAGPAGKDGTNGNANVASSNTVTLNIWSSDFDNGTDYIYSSTLSWAAITQSIVDKGVVLVYMSDGSGGWVALPYSDIGTGYSASITFGMSVGSVSIEASGYDASGSPGASSLNGTTVRVVAIASSSRAMHPEVDLTNYNEVKKEFNLKD